MDDKLQDELNKITEIGNGKKIIRTSTITQLLNDLNRSIEDYDAAIDYLESRGIGLDVDDSERKPFLDSSKIAIVPKTLSVEAITKKIRYKEINLDTEFQRKRSLWKNDVKSQLIESFMVQLPIPPMYFDGQNADDWLVIDGLQRLCTLKEFLLEHTLVLSDMEYLPDYNGCRFDDLPRIYQRRIEEAQIAFYLILPGTPIDVKYSLFKRINTPGLKLEPQEIRHALYQGKATRFLQELAESQLFREVTDNDVPSERMQDREMVLRYFAIKYMGESVYKEHTLDGYLCETMDFLNKQQNDEFFEENKVVFFDTLRCCQDIFGKSAFRRISKTKPYDKKPFNSTLFESWMNVISGLNSNQRKSLVSRKEILVKRYIDELDKRSTFNADISSGKYRSFVRRNNTVKEMVEEVLAVAEKSQN
ncbi:MAG: DUF262 domain-containing protein [Lachnospiraceae bacterium]|nr:DUF262 domain-containing protein [Lachnospiraceae bacterium]